MELGTLEFQWIKRKVGAHTLQKESFFLKQGYETDLWNVVILYPLGLELTLRVHMWNCIQSSYVDGAHTSILAYTIVESFLQSSQFNFRNVVSSKKQYRWTIPF